MAHGGYGPPGGVGTLSWVGVGHGIAFGRVSGAVGGVRRVRVGHAGLRGHRVGFERSGAVEPSHNSTSDDVAQIPTQSARRADSTQNERLNCRGVAPLLETSLSTLVLVLLVSVS